jgi:Lipocalin-like domain
MDRRSVLTGSAMTVFALAALQKGAVAQQQQPPRPPQQQQPPQPPKPWKELIVGSWNLLIDDGIAPDGSRVPRYGPNPKGLLIFGADGRYSLQIMRDARPKFAGNDRLKGTPDEMKAAFQGMISHFGTYTINEADKSFTIRIEGSSYPNWDGTTQKRTITALVGDDFVYANQAPSSAVANADRSELAWRRVK